MASIAAMLRKLLPVAAVALGLCSALLLAACGDSNAVEPKLSAADARILQDELDVIQENVDDGNCAVAQSHAQTLVDQVQQLAGAIDPDLLEALEEGAKSLRDLLEDPANCEEQTVTTETTEVTEETETEVTKETETTETAPTEPTVPTVPTTPTEPTPPPGDGSGGTGL
jgi:hypothetical protein